MTQILYFFTGLLLGGFTVGLWFYLHNKKTVEIAAQLNENMQAEKTAEMENIVAQLKESFGALSGEALSRNTSDFLKIASETLKNQSQANEQNLASKKELIDQTLKNMKGDLDKVEELMQKMEKERKLSYGELTQQLRQTSELTQHLQQTTQQLNTALTHSQMRGQWGERMAEDVLRMAGFIEGINYLKQKSVTDGSTRPDFTFLLPHNLKVNMDVKFPLTNYIAYLQTESKIERQQFKNKFLKDVRARIQEVKNRNYINPADNTVDYVIVFIPNEQVYSFINENNQGLLDEAMRNKVILSSPLTLYAVLSVIRQAVDNFNLEKTATEILNLLAEFNKQWQNYKESMDKMGRRIDDAQKEFQNLTATRTNQLERPLQKMEELRSRNQLALPENTK